MPMSSSCLPADLGIEFDNPLVTYTHPLSHPLTSSSPYSSADEYRLLLLPPPHLTNTHPIRQTPPGCLLA